MGHDARRPSRAVQQSREKTGPRTRAAALVASSWDPEARTIDVIWSTGADVERADFWTGARWVERLSMEAGHVRLDRLNAGANFLRAHEQGDLNAVMGVVVDGSARIEDGRGVATVRLSDREDVRGLVGDIATGIIRNVSVGYQVHAETKSKDGATEVRTAVDWEPVEISAVPVPADAGAHVRGKMTRKVKPTVEIRAVDPVAAQECADMAAEVAAKCAEMAAEAAGDEPEDEQAQPAASVPDEPKPRALSMAETESVRVAERARIAAIRSASAKLHLPETAADVLVASGADVATARAALTDQAAEAAKGTRIMNANRVDLVTDAADTKRAALVNALQFRGDPQRHKIQEIGRPFARMRLIDLARMSMEDAGVQHRHLSDWEVFGRMFTRAQGSSDFAELLADVTNKSLLAAYAEVEPMYPAIAAQGTIRNLQTRYPTILSGVADLTEVAEGADFPVGSLSDKRESYNAAKYGKIIEITLEALIRDQLDGFTRLPAQMAAAARRIEESVVIGLINTNGNLADGVALFATATHANLAGAGDTGTPTAARLDATEKLIAVQTGLNSEKLNLVGRTILVPRALRHTAEQLFSPNYYPTAATGVIAGALRDLQVKWSRYLDDTSQTAWFVFADPSQSPVIEYAFVEGQEGITVAEEEGFANQVHRYRVTHFFGAGVVDYRGAAKNNGA